MREAVRDLMVQRFGRRLAIRTISYCLRRVAFMPQRPVEHAYEQSPVAVARCLEQTYPVFCSRAKRERAVVLSGDEMASVPTMPVAAALHQQARRRSCGRLAGRGFGCCVKQAAGNRGELYLCVFAARLTDDAFIDFLRRLL